DHPYPDMDSFNAAHEIISEVEKKNDCLFIILISGGGSSLFTYPDEPISIQEVSELNRLLIESGADIHQINTVRKHISQVKGGKFGKFCSQHGKVISLILSDVVGDDMSDIASGLTYPDNTSFKDAKDVLENYNLWKKIPESIREHIEKGLDGDIKETPKNVDTDSYLIGNNLLALREMKKIGEKEGFNTKILTSQNTGKAKEVAKPFAGIAKEIQDSSNPLKTPAALLIGGETTVDISGENSIKGKGGPNREFILSFALEVRNRKKMVAASVDSDGTDGVGKAGAIADTTSIKRCKLDAEKLLAKHDSQRFFDYLDDSIEFESETNVNDLTVILIDEI
ncbi:MAG: glycerate kinase type-2 family protein, partial [Thermoplasmatota archaeon]